MPRSAYSPNFGGILLMLGAVSLLSVMDAGLKQLSSQYPPLQVCALRSLSSWPLIAAWALSTVGARALLRVRWSLQLFRGAVGIATLVLFVYGLKHLPLTTAYSLFFVAPLIIAAQSALILGEHVERASWIAIGLGFTGVLIALRPSGGGFVSLPALAVLAAALGYASSAIAVRVLGRTDSTQSMVFWVITMMGLGSLVLALPQWVAVRSGDWLLIAGIGVVGGLGQYCITEAFRRAQASVIAPIEYTALVWSVGFDALVWHSLPGPMTWAGAAIIVGAGAYLLRHARARVDVREAQLQP